MEKKTRDLLIISAILIVGFYLLILPKIFQTTKLENNAITLDEGIKKISSLLQKDNASFDKLKKGEIILIQGGKLVSDYSPENFAKLGADLISLKMQIQQKDESKDKQALLKSIDLYIEVLKLEQEEKGLYTAANAVAQKSTDLKSSCQNIEELKKIPSKEIELDNAFSGLNKKTNELFLAYANLDKIDSLLLDVGNPSEIENNFDFLFDVQQLEQLCGITNSPETV